MGFLSHTGPGPSMGVIGGGCYSEQRTGATGLCSPGLTPHVRVQPPQSDHVTVITLPQRDNPLQSRAGQQRGPLPLKPVSPALSSAPTGSPLHRLLSPRGSPLQGSPLSTGLSAHWLSSFIAWTTPAVPDQDGRVLSPRIGPGDAPFRRIWSCAHCAGWALGGPCWSSWH